MWSRTICALTSLVCILGVVFVSFSEQDALIPPFRASDTISFPDLVLSSHERKILYDFMRQHKGNVCGIAAPNIGKYVQFMILDIEGVLHEMVNPSYTAEVTLKYPPFREESLMCVDNYNSMERFITITATYYLSAYGFAQPHTETLHGRASICYQHFVDVFSGKWPCANQTSQVLIPVTLSQASFTV